MSCSHKKLQLDMQTINYTKKLLKQTYAPMDIQCTKMIKHKWGWGIMNKLGKLEKKVTVFMHTGGTSF